MRIPLQELPDKLKTRLVNFLNPPPTVLGRVACVGQDVFYLKTKGKFRLINLQKARLDLLMNWIEGAQRPKSRIVEKWMVRKDVFPFIEQQERLDWLESKERPQFIMMDSYSELTDQQFTHRKQGWSFCCHYSDLMHTPDFERLFQSNGLLALEDMESTYYRFFNWLEQSSSPKQVVFVHYSTRFDQRAQFKNRAAEILRVMLKLQSSKPYIYNLWLDDTFYYPSEGDDFPYHYSPKTYESLVQVWDYLEREKRLISCLS
jgi:hypothetical protein